MRKSWRNEILRRKSAKALAAAVISLIVCTTPRGAWGQCGPPPKPTLPPGVIHVPADFPTIQGAIDAATPPSEIVVAPGTYNEAINFWGKAITVRSVAGPEVTILDGTGLNDTVVRCDHQEGPDTVLRGFTLTGGITGGMMCAGPFGANFGGAMIIERSTPTIEDCAIVGNSAEFAGGVFVYAPSPMPGRVTFSNCTFTSNERVALYAFTLEVAVVDCRFTCNRSTPFYGIGGAMWLVSDANYPSSEVVRCVFTDNEQKSSGGALYAQFAIVTLEDCVFQNNHAVLGPGSGHASGGAVSANNGILFVDRCHFRNNSAGEFGGAIDSNNCPAIQDSTFFGNTARFYGGAVFGNIEDVTNCLFVANRVPGPPIGYGGAVASFSNFANCAFANNVAATNGGGYRQLLCMTGHDQAASRSGLTLLPSAN